MLVWDKEWIGPGGTRGLRPSYELVALMCAENGGLKNRGLYDIQRFAWSSQKPTGHPAEKPTSLLEWLIDVSGGETVLDMFCGSGTTLVSAKKLGRHYLGFEISPEYCELTRSRLDLIDAQPGLFPKSPAEQMPLCQ